MRILVADTETDGLAYECSKLHVMSWTEDGETYESTNNYDKMRRVYESADLLVMHNAVQHDQVVFNRLLGIPFDYRKYVDTLWVSRYLYPDRASHGLDAIGKEYGVPKLKIDDWQNLNYDTYKERCEYDVRINWLEWLKQKKRLEEIYEYEEMEIYGQPRNS